MDNYLVLLSGGQDSATCLFWALSKTKNVKAIGFNYNQRHKNELEYAKKICKIANVEFEIININFLSAITNNALTKNIDINETGKIPNTFVDGRNLLFLSIAGIQSKQQGIHDIVTGVCQTDFSGYPDCRDIFIKSLNVTLNLAMDYNFKIHTPLMWLNKAETWKLADELGVIDIIKNNTMTCYNGNNCGKCPSCKLRIKGYEEYIKNEEKNKCII